MCPFAYAVFDFLEVSYAYDGCAGKMPLQNEAATIYGCYLYCNAVHCVQNYKLPISTDKGKFVWDIGNLIFL